MFQKHIQEDDISSFTMDLETLEIFDEHLYRYCIAKDKPIFLDALLSNRSYATNNFIASLLLDAIRYDSLGCYEVLLSYGAYLSDEMIALTIDLNGKIAKDRNCAIFYEEDKILQAINLDKPQIIIAILNENIQELNQTHLKYAINENKIKTFRYMLTRCDDIRYSDLLSQAIKKQDINFVKIILQSNIAPTSKDLNDAIILNNYDIVKLLLSHDSITSEEYDLFKLISGYGDFNNEEIKHLIPHVQSWHLTAISTNDDLKLFEDFTREIFELVDIRDEILQKWLQYIVKYECLNLLNVISTYALKLHLYVFLKRGNRIYRCDKWSIKRLKSPYTLSVEKCRRSTRIKKRKTNDAVKQC